MKRKWSIRRNKERKTHTNTHAQTHIDSITQSPATEMLKATQLKKICKYIYVQKLTKTWTNEKTEKEDAKPLLLILRSFVHPYLSEQTNSVAQYFRELCREWNSSAPNLLRNANLCVVFHSHSIHIFSQMHKQINLFPICFVEHLFGEVFCYYTRVYYFTWFSFIKYP